ncbi:uncharacterized protein MELLADRAFT_123889 [Melampsora larici-populina 98AG31]|uniref:Secreted protein n=1 Tax=Melampsora larici-populina (strain 98AG31 / pathotype 3-4-7) TaxID=747676 RepID=F4RHC4_MELLP|nr:uncharacterized protein MELLADRAFT_123889 [Melampsora larici-populina 98AG31]EGG08272.1 secreted protein [Melampsora larici-populina 98AG31]
MAMNRSNPIFFLVLVFLLAGDLSSNIFANAQSVECNTFWQLPKDSDDGRYKCGGKDPDGKKYIYSCSWCGRGDNKPCSAKDCVPAGNAPRVNTRGAFPCDAGEDENYESQPVRPIFCYHKNAQGLEDTYHCASRHLNQQCPLNLCKRTL